MSLKRFLLIVIFFNLPFSHAQFKQVILEAISILRESNNKQELQKFISDELDRPYLVKLDTVRSLLENVVKCKNQQEETQLLIYAYENVEEVKNYFKNKFDGSEKKFINSKAIIYLYAYVASSLVSEKCRKLLGWEINDEEKLDNNIIMQHIIDICFS